MKKYQVQYSAEALDDLRRIYQYIANELKAPQAARGQVDRIRKAIRSLSTTPDRFSTVDWEPWLTMGMRKIPVNNYLAFYLVENTDSTVTVVRIFYSGRNIEEIIQEDQIP